MRRKNIALEYKCQFANQVTLYCKKKLKIIWKSVEYEKTKFIFYY